MGSPPSVAFSRWRESRSAQIATGQHVNGEVCMEDGSMESRIMIGSITLPLDGSGDMQPIAEGARSNHLLDPVVDRISCASPM